MRIKGAFKKSDTPHERDQRSLSQRVNLAANKTCNKLPRVISYPKNDRS